MYNDLMIKKCPVCGRTFTSTAHARKYCDIECARDASYIRSAERVRKYRMRARHATKGDSLAKINTLAREEGLTYGKYVAKYGI